MTRAGMVAAGVIIAVLGVGCSGSDDGDDTEVAGAVLERDGNGEPAELADPDDPRTDPSGSAEEQDEATDEVVAGDAQGDTDAGGASEVDEQPDNSDQAGTSEGSSIGTEAQGGADDQGGASAQGSADGSSRAPTTTATGTSPRPQPAPLASGEGLPGNVVGFSTDGAEVLMSGPLEQPPTAGARSDAVRVGDDVRCETWLQASEDRGLLARGQLTVSVVVEPHDGELRRVPLTEMALEVELVSGERFELPTSQPYAIDPTRMAALSCHLDFAPR